MITNLESNKTSLVEYNTAKLISFLCQVYLIIVLSYIILPSVNFHLYLDFFLFNSKSIRVAKIYNLFGF